MKNKDIYKAALHLLSQPVSEDENEDFEDRAPFLISAFCFDVLEIDSALRRLLGIKPLEDFNRVYLPLDEDFPLVDKLAYPAAKYLAAMLVIDENPELSDKLYEQYCDSISRLRSEIPCVSESIKNKYL